MSMGTSKYVNVSDKVSGKNGIGKNRIPNRNSIQFYRKKWRWVYLIDIDAGNFSRI